jgi:hypothetical protein
VKSVTIRGGGVAGCCCARLLKRAGFSVAVEQVDRPRLPAIMLSETTQKLLQDVFEANELFQGLHRIRRRMVLWGDSKEPVMLPHSAIVVSEQAILERLQEPLPLLEPEQEISEWSIVAAGRAWEAGAAPSMEHHFGSRMACASPVTLKTEAAADACWIESLGEGWLFLLPCARQSGWLLSVGASPETMLAQSRLLAHQIAETGSGAGRFPSQPRIAEPLAAPGWLACGSAALGFDPLCGDGAGNAAREAILCVAVIQAASQGADVTSVAAHYTARLTAGFRRHLEVCREFYQSGGRGAWWDRQVSDLDRGLDWTSAQLSRLPGFQYRLNGFSLERVE